MDYIRGNCKDYGVKSLKLCPHEISGNGQLMQWRCFQKVLVGLTRGEKKKVTRLECFETFSFNFVTYLKPKLAHFIVHDFVSKWLDKKFNNVF